VWEKAFSNRKLLIRLHNIEHIYYNRLAGLEKNFFRKKYYELEAKRLLQYERKLANKAILLPLNRMDENYFQNEFGARRIQYLPVFTPWDVVESVLGKSDYCLYHGNLQV